MVIAANYRPFEAAARPPQVNPTAPCRLGGAPIAPAKGGLAPWAERRCLDLMRARLSEDISLDELAAEAQLSPFHFARMFKQSVGVPPRVYLTRLRMEKACELLELTDIPITEIAFDVGYSPNPVLARVFAKHQHMSPSDYRRAVRDPVRPVSLQCRQCAGRHQPSPGYQGVRRGGRRARVRRSAGDNPSAASAMAPPAATGWRLDV
ncbi:helix-turn-helix domain-containing protein [Rubrimonas cliftonensis]|uniref:helix-turn-helix domain-containing protein n=1 Tax=Rubrimonas cliftonensis TaxID=89524 RepID=UPI001FE0A96E|nr:AraC family transcriptional regulator [Rubrimonas cliftonensis]